MMSIGFTPLALLVACGLSLSAFDLFRKSLSRHLAPLPMVFLLALASVPLFGVALLFERWGGDGSLAPAAGYLPPAVASVALNLVAHLAFVQAVRISPLSLTVPLLSLTPVFTTVMGALLLGERPSVLGTLGIALVVGGAFVLSAPEDREEGGWRRMLHQPGAALMVLTAFLWSLTLPLDKLAVARSSAAFHGFFLTAGIAAGAFAILLASRRLSELARVRRAPGVFILTLLASTLALGFQLLALKMVLVSVVETVKRGVGNLMAVALGRLAFGEQLTLRKLGSASAMAAGVTLIMLSG